MAIDWDTIDVLSSLEEMNLQIQQLVVVVHRLDRKLNTVVGMERASAAGDIIMRKSLEDLSAEIEDIKTKVDDFTTRQGEALAAAVAEARAAIEAEDDAAINAATAKLDEISNQLVEFKPEPEPQPSA